MARGRIEELEKEKRAVAKTIDEDAAAKKKAADEGKDTLDAVVVERAFRVVPPRVSSCDTCG